MSKTTQVSDIAARECAFVTARDMAAYWGVAVCTVWRDIRKGAIPVHRLPGGRVRIAKADALAYGKPDQ